MKRYLLNLSGKGTSMIRRQKEKVPKHRPGKSTSMRKIREEMVAKHRPLFTNGPRRKLVWVPYPLSFSFSFLRSSPPSPSLFDSALCCREEISESQERGGGSLSRQRGKKKIQKRKKVAGRGVGKQKCGPIGGKEKQQQPRDDRVMRSRQCEFVFFALARKASGRVFFLRERGRRGSSHDPYWHLLSRMLETCCWDYSAGGKRGRKRKREEVGFSG